MPETFAIIRESSKRILGMKHFEVQCVGGVVLHQGGIAEMRTGEGKTLVATLPASLNAMSGRGVHVITVNEYLAKRDSEIMSKLYNFLGLNVGLISSGMSSAEKKAAYKKDILYATNNELGFDYLRDNMALELDEQMRRGFNYAIIDEVDSVLIDEARTPLIISSLPEQSDKEIFEVMDELAKSLNKGKDRDDEDNDYYIDEKSRNVILTDLGISKAEKFLGVNDLWSEDPNIAHRLNQALKAREIFKKDIDYVVQYNSEKREKEVVIVDGSTGRIMSGRRWSNGIHQAVEAKEKVPIQDEALTQASVTYQNFFRLYPKLSGMTGTGITEEDEFKAVYNLSVVPIPPNKGYRREDLNNKIFRSEEQKFYAIVEDIAYVHGTGRPVLVGTNSVEKSEMLSEMLSNPGYMADLLKFRAFRLVNWLKDNEASAGILINNLENFSENPWSATKKGSREIFEKSIQDKRLSKKLKDLISSVLEIKPKEKPSREFTFFQSFLRSCEVVEIIKNGIKHFVLNAKQHEREALIVAQAGRYGSVTIATNMAGRGTDVPLGGNPSYWAKEALSKHLHLQEKTDEYEKELKQIMANVEPEFVEEEKAVSELGGLYVIGTEISDSRRVDDQLKGRCARQGDPGATVFYLSVEDNLIHLFGKDELAGAIDKLSLDEDIAIENQFITQGIEKVQKKVESFNYEIRKRVLEFDNIQDMQRKRIYEERQKVLEGKDLKETFIEIYKERIEEILLTHLDPEKPPESWFEKIEIDDEKLEEDGISEEDLPTYLDLALGNIFLEMPDLENNPKIQQENLQAISYAELQEIIVQSSIEVFDQKTEDFSDEVMQNLLRKLFLQSIDQYWIQHLRALESLKDNIHLRGYGNKQPIVEYRNEALNMFDELIHSIRKEAAMWIAHANIVKYSQDQEEKIPALVL